MTVRDVVAACLTLAILTGCGIPADDGARPLSADEVEPLPGPASPTTSRLADPSPVPVALFLVRDSRLVAVSREAPTSSVDDALAALAAGPTPEERSQGMRTALTSPVGLAGVRSPRVPVVDVAESFAQIEGEEQILALAQIVFTLTGVPGVDGVAFTLAGREVEVPTGDGTLKAGPLGREDFAAVAPLG